MIDATSWAAVTAAVVAVAGFAENARRNTKRDKAEARKARDDELKAAESRGVRRALDAVRMRRLEDLAGLKHQDDDEPADLDE
jgi:hypothetical protein